MGHGRRQWALGFGLAAPLIARLAQVRWYRTGLAMFGHPLDLTGDLYQTRTVLRYLEDVLARYLFQDAHENDQALAAINQACRIVDASWEQQVEILHPL